MNGKWDFWIDRGGTFTDIVARDPKGRIHAHKLLSVDPARYEDAAIAGIEAISGHRRPFPAGLVGTVRMGTTVATNALLERKGERLLLLVTAGFRDLLRIRHQTRARLFDLKAGRPEPLYEMVEELPERLDAEGKVLRPLDHDATRTMLRSARERGIRVVAIVGMHAWLNPVHEQEAAAIAREMGFTHVSASHEMSRLAKIIGRGDTAVVDAYLSPVLRAYIGRVSTALELGSATERLLFMQSSGGLVESGIFRGKDAILSGPAGGIVGMACTADAAGFDRVIGFDMGGTSTDVSHYAGSFERVFESEVAGAFIRSPMLDIHTVAAGGGSICQFRDGRLQVGPESAGADPGPACYRRGGPLTVTDCNVMLGRIVPGHFPQLFGPDGNKALDADVVRQKFEDLAREVAKATGRPQESPVATALAFLRIAVDNMANAIKKVSIERGHDVSRYALHCFGGAGGQHACMVADALGMKRVLVHPLAGLLSAYGMGLADIRCLREAQLDVPVQALDQASAALRPIAAEAEAKVRAQGAKSVQILSRAHLRYSGAHQTLPVEFSLSAAAMRREFEGAHRSRFGYVMPSSEVIIEMIGVEAIGAAGEVPSILPTGTGGHSQGSSELMGSDGTLTAQMFVRSQLAVGQTVPGPAIITEENGTNVIDPGWAATVDRFGNLVITRTGLAGGEPAITSPSRRRRRAEIGADPLHLELFNNLFMSVADQMGVTLANTAWSVNIKERLDFSCAIFDAKGDLVANAPHVPVHLGSMSDSVKTVIRRNPQAVKGDAFVLNSPFDGGTHLPDVTVVSPLTVQGRPVMWLASRGHHADIGGRTPGSAPPDSRHINEEGVVVENLHLVRNGELQQQATTAALSSGRYPCRNIEQNMADLTAQVAANETGCRALEKVIGDWGLDMVKAYTGHVQDNAEESVRRVIGRLSDGEFNYPLDHGARIRVALSVDRRARSARIDFSGTSPQHQGNYNAPLAISRAVVLYVFRTLVDEAIPLNQGCLKPLEIVVPRGSMLDPAYPAAVISGNTEVSQAACNALLGALGVIACSQGTVNNFVWGNESFQNYETICGGSGAGPGFDGCDAVHSHMTNTRATDPEILERRFPVRLEEFAIRANSGGAGRWRGGNGCRRRLRFLDDVTVTTLCSHRLVPPFGGGGGQPGAVGVNWAEMPDGTRVACAGNHEINLPSGAVFGIETPGGGGWGSPA